MIYRIVIDDGFWMIYEPQPERIRIMNIGREDVDPHTIFC
jgi:hypothetical protein